MSGGPAASPPTSVEELRALVVELVEANAGLREVIAAKDHQIASAERRIAELERAAGCRFVDLESATVVGFAVSQTGEVFLADLLGAPAG